MLDWILGKIEKHDIDEDHRVCAIAIDHSGTAWQFTSCCPDRYQLPAPEAEGCGNNFAIAAMMAGADAQQAVEITCKLDTHCGGDIQCFEFLTNTLTGPFSHDY